MNSSQIQFFRQNGYVPLPDVLTSSEVEEFLELYESDRREFPQMWVGFSDQMVNCDCLLTTPNLDHVIRHPKILSAVEVLLGGPAAFGEICIRHMGHYDGESPKRGWHRDKPHWREHPFRMDYIQLMLYLSDVNEGTHCFSLSPESVDDEILEDHKTQIARGGILDFHGPAGSVMLFNVSVLHTATVRATQAERKSIQVYYGHRDRPYISNCTVIPESFWRDHPDEAVCGFYGCLNRKTRRYLTEKKLGKLSESPDAILEWCLRYDREQKAADNAASRVNEHGTLGE